MVYDVAMCRWLMSMVLILYGYVDAVYVDGAYVDVAYVFATYEKVALCL